VEDERSPQRELQRGSWQCRQHAVTVVQPGHYERQDQLLCDFLADPTTNLAQTTNVVEASSSDFGDVFFHRQ